MEPSGPSGGPFNLWDPPLPPPPPPPPGFHRHHFHPFNGPPDHFNGPPDHFNGPPDNFNGPPDHFNYPPDHFNGPPDHFNGCPPDHFHGPPDHFNGGPPDHFNGGPPDHFNGGPPDHFNGGPPDHFNGGPPDHFNGGPPDHFNGGPPDHFNGPSDPFNGPPDHHPGGGGGGYGHQKPHFNRKRKLDHKPDSNGNCAKLYVGAVPRTVTQEEVRHLFEDFGNVVEVVLPTDKRTGQQQEYCFVKYASVEEAERAIVALHNQWTFPGAMTPLRVKYADGERQRLGLSHLLQQESSLSRTGPIQHDVAISEPVNGEAEHKITKVFVIGLNREASTEEVKEVFSSYGIVVDVYIMRDDLKRSRGCGFVGFTHRYMAVAAINGLNGIYVMRGCNKPLIVRFADPKKPKNGNFRAHPLSGDMRLNHLPGGPPMGNPPICTELNSTGIQTGTNQLCPGSSELKQTFPRKPFSTSLLPPVSLQESQSFEMSSQYSRQKDSQTMTPMQHDHQSPQAGRDVELESPMLPSPPVISGISASGISEAPVVCDWSEHICPEGEKYYFNCVTWESRWEMPEEFSLLKQQWLKQKLQKRSCEENHARTLQAPSAQQIEAATCQGSSDFDKAQLAGSCAEEHSHEQLHIETNTIGGPACVQ